MKQTQEEKDAIKQLCQNIIPMEYRCEHWPADEWLPVPAPFVLWDDEKTSVRIKPGHEPKVESTQPPKHYTQGLPEGMQVLDIMRLRGEELGYLESQITKYYFRYPYKDQQVSDLRKLADCATKLADLYEKEGK